MSFEILDLRFEFIFGASEFQTRMYVRKKRKRQAVGCRRHTAR